MGELLLEAKQAVAEGVQRVVEGEESGHAAVSFVTRFPHPFLPDFGQMLTVLRLLLLLDRLVLWRAAAVADCVEVVVCRRCALFQDIESQALAVLAADVHEQRVVGDAEDP